MNNGSPRKAAAANTITNRQFGVMAKICTEIHNMHKNGNRFNLNSHRMRLFGIERSHTLTVGKSEIQ